MPDRGADPAGVGRAARRLAALFSRRGAAAGTGLGQVGQDQTGVGRAGRRLAALFTRREAAAGTVLGQDGGMIDRSTAGADPSPATAELAWTTLTEASGRLGRGEVSSAGLVANALRRIREVDRAGPALLSVLAVDPRATEVAESLDAEAAAGRRRSPLHGLPVVVKDSVDTAGLATTAGSLALAEAPPPTADATCVARLRAAGAVVLGKVNLSEWSNFRGTGSVSGWSAVGGQTRNPHDLDRSPGGSSSGSAAAVAAGIVAGAVGAETDGSILCPAAWCGVVGLKPTVGLVPRRGVVPISATQDSVGVMARTVADAALLLSAVAGADPDDPTSGLPGPPGSGPAPAPGFSDYTAGLDPDCLRGARLGVPRAGFWGYSPKVDAVVEAALGVLAGAGAALVDPANIPTAPQLRASDDELVVLHHELGPGLASYLATRPAPAPRSLGDIIAFNSEHAGQELGLFGQEHFLAAAASPGLDDPRYLAALTSNLRRARGGLDAVLGAWHLDALVVPTISLPPYVDHLAGDVVSGAGYGVSALAGYPAITVPAGTVEGLPVGLCLLGGAWSEARLLSLAHAFQLAAPVDVRPGFCSLRARPHLAVGYAS
ncbi:MAG: amidase [Acidimicrobiales bacterium]